MKWAYNYFIFRDNLQMLANDILLYVSGNLLHFFDPETKDASYLR